MAWDPKWEEIFKSRSWGKYPPEELVRFFARNFYQVADRKSVRVLEVGCGAAGGAACFLGAEGFDYYGVDGSPEAIKISKKYFEDRGLSGHFHVADALDLPFEDSFFDCVVDVGCFCCNSVEDTRRILTETRRVLKDGGSHFSFMTPTNKCWGAESPKEIDAWTTKDPIVGPYQGCGTVRFSDLELMLDLYRDFKAVNVEESTRTTDGRQHLISVWCLTSVK